MAQPKHAMGQEMLDRSAFARLRRASKLAEAIEELTRPAAARARKKAAAQAAARAREDAAIAAAAGFASSTTAAGAGGAGANKGAGGTGASGGGGGGGGDRSPSHRNKKKGGAKVELLRPHATGERQKPTPFVKLAKFRHVEGCKTCEALYRHYKLPDGSMAHFYQDDDLEEEVRGAPPLWCWLYGSKILTWRCVDRWKTLE